MSKSKSKSAEPGITGMALVRLNQAKDGFFNQCKQYKRLGTLLVAHAKSMNHPLLQKTPAPETLKAIIEQYQEIGEQMKQIGKELDAMGGETVMGEPSFPKPKQKQPKERTTKKVKRNVYIQNPSQEETQPVRKEKKNG